MCSIGLRHTVEDPSARGRRIAGSLRPPSRGFLVLRDRTAGSLRPTDDGATVTLAGWVARRRDHGGVIFIDLRDASGVSQVVFHSGDVLAAAHALRSEFCIQV